MNKDVKLEVDKVMKEKNVKLYFYQFKVGVISFLYKFENYEHEFYKIQKNYSDLDIIEIEKYILNNYTKNPEDFVNYTFPKLLYITAILSENKFVCDDELFKFYKAFYVLSGIKLYFKIMKFHKRFKEISFKNSHLNIDKSVELLSKSNLDVLDLILKVSDLAESEILDVFSEIGLKLVLFLIKHDYNKSEPYSNNFYDLFIERWNEFGIKEFKDSFE